jgi:hypothetical protein
VSVVPYSNLGGAKECPCRTVVRIGKLKTRRSRLFDLSLPVLLVFACEPQSICSTITKVELGKV